MGLSASTWSGATLVTARQGSTGMALTVQVTGVLGICYEKRFSELYLLYDKPLFNYESKISNLVFRLKNKWISKFWRKSLRVCWATLHLFHDV